MKGEDEKEGNLHPKTLILLYIYYYILYSPFCLGFDPVQGKLFWEILTLLQPGSSEETRHYDDNFKQ